MPEPYDSVSISEFKATCLARLERVRRTGRRLLVTRRGEPIALVVPPTTGTQRQDWLGSAAASGRLLDDGITPVLGPTGASD